ncbi:MAG TPA: helix-turn-helix transcriptional regulator [Candidatus Sulfotelmatobacter sp.]|nr:helix-turn-helix transcriptional regulator [Candidatus Sulfotelmatobacter sp.]
MKHLNSLDYRYVLECIAELYQQDDISRLKQRLPEIVSRLVPSALVWLVDFSPQRRDPPKIHSTYPENCGFTFEPEAIEIIYREHPAIQHIARTGCMDTIKLSDFMSSRQYHQTRLYSEGLGRHGVEYNIGFQVLEPTLADVTSVCFARDRCDFSETERLKLDLLRPHVGRAYIHAMQMAAWREKAALASDALAATRQAVIVANTDGTAAFCTDAARSYLACYFNNKPSDGDRLPSEICRWMSGQELPDRKSGQIPTPRGPFTTERDGRRLTVHLLSGRKVGQRLLLLEEKRIYLSAEPLQTHFGLSARRAEVLLWIAQGKTSEEIAIILGLSVSTVHKHTERIFERLGVESRTAAALQAVEVINRP